MPYGTVKVDNITFTNSSADQTTTVSGIYRAITSGVTVTGTISGAVIQGTTISGTTVTGTTANFISGVFTTLSGASTTVASGIFAVGSAAAPSISFTSDPNTGIYSPSADQIGLSTNGTARLVIGSAGAVTIPNILTCSGAIKNSSVTPAIIWGDTSGSTPGIENFWLVKDNDQFTFQTRSTADAFVATNYAQDLGASGSTNHRWFINGLEDMRLDSSGRLLIGVTGAVTVGTTPGLLLSSTATTNGAHFSIARYGNDTSASTISFAKSRSNVNGTIGGIVVANDQVGLIDFRADNGTNFNSQAASIVAAIDGTPGIADMPGRLVFSTTGIGATSVTERMRINSSGQVGIGTTPDVLLHLSSATGTLVPSPTELRIASTSSGSDWSTTDPWGRIGFFTADTSGLGVAHNHIVFDAVAATAVGSTSNLELKLDNGTTGGLITRLTVNYLGTTTIFANSSNPALIANVGGTEFFRIDSGGRLLIGTSVARANFLNSTAGSFLQVEGTSFNNSVISITRNSNDIAPGTLLLNKSRGTVDGSNVLTLSGDATGDIFFSGNDGTEFVATARISSAVDGTAAANDMPGRLIFLTTAAGAATPTERLRIDSSGRMGFNSTSLGGVNGAYRFAGNITGAASSSGIVYTPTVQSDITGTALLFNAQPVTASNGGTPYTIATLKYFSANQATFNVDSTVTEQRGFSAESTMVGATTNIGFYGNIPSGTGRWNFYAVGTANNYFAGSVGIGSTAPLAKLHVRDVVAAGEMPIFLSNNSATAGASVALYLSPSSGTLTTGSIRAAAIKAICDVANVTNLAFFTNTSGADPLERMRIDSSGRVGIGTTSPANQSTTQVTADNDGIRVQFSGTPITGQGPRLIFGHTTNNGTQQIFAAIKSLMSNGNDVTWNSDLAFYTGGSSLAERLRIDSNGRVLVGTSTALGVGSATPSEFEIETIGLPLSIVRNSADGTGSVLALGKSRGTSAGSLTSVVDGDILGELRFAAADGSTRSSIGASIQTRVDGTPGVSDMPGRLVFNTTADGTASPTERFRITNDGVIAHDQATPSAVNATATLTIGNLKVGIITSTSAAATDMTLPTGTDTQAGFSGTYDNFTFEWSVINTGPSLVRVLANTAHTIVGSGSVATGTSGRFTSRRTAANTFVTYRLA